jgi:hypothetical protein
MKETDQWLQSIRIDFGSNRKGTFQAQRMLTTLRRSFQWGERHKSTGPPHAISDSRITPHAHVMCSHCKPKSVYDPTWEPGKPEPRHSRRKRAQQDKYKLMNMDGDTTQKSHTAVTKDLSGIAVSLFAPLPPVDSCKMEFLGAAPG